MSDFTPSAPDEQPQGTPNPGAAPPPAAPQPPQYQAPPGAPQPPQQPQYQQPPQYQAPPGAPQYQQAPGQPPYGQQPYAQVPVPLSAQGQPIAEWWQRLVAILIDGAILGIPFTIVAFVIVGASIGTGGGASLIVIFLVDLVFAAVELAYFSILLGSAKGQTVGMTLMKIKVIDAATGGPIDLQRAGLRTLVLLPGIVLYVIPFLGLVLGPLAGLWTLVCGLSPLWNDGRKGYHDIFSKTDVIKLPA